MTARPSPGTTRRYYSRSGGDGYDEPLLSFGVRDIAGTSAALPPAPCLPAFAAPGVPRMQECLSDPMRRKYE